MSRMPGRLEHTHLNEDGETVGDLDVYRAMSGSPDEARWTPEGAP